jgi:hypothetical protein
MSTGPILVLSLVHPDFLAPLHAAATFFAEEGRSVEIVTFSSPAPASPNGAANPRIIVCGSHSGTAMQRISARRRFRAVAAERALQRPAAIIAACPFSFLEALRIGPPGVPIVYWVFELYEASARDRFRSPATAWRNWRARREMSRATLVCAPSPERAGWIAARAGLRQLPTTVLNAPHAGSSAALAEKTENHSNALPADFAGKTLVLHTGGLSRTHAVLELVESMVGWPPDTCLAISNVGNSPYALRVRQAVESSPRRTDIALLPLLPRAQMLALQRRAHVGICLLREGDAPETLMPAPNKVGEYVHAGLITVGARMPYLDQLEHHGVAVLADTLEPDAIGRAVTAASLLSKDAAARRRVLAVARDWYCMEVQIRPLVRLIEHVQ